MHCSLDATLGLCRLRIHEYVYILLSQVSMYLHVNVQIGLIACMRAGLEVGGVAVTLLDTAGLRAASDAVERIGVARSHAAAAAADVVMLVYDSQACSMTQQATVCQGTIQPLGLHGLLRSKAMLLLRRFFFFAQDSTCKTLKPCSRLAGQRRMHRPQRASGASRVYRGPPCGMRWQARVAQYGSAVR